MVNVDGTVLVRQHSILVRRHTILVRWHLILVRWQTILVRFGDSIGCNTIGKVEPIDDESPSDESGARSKNAREMQKNEAKRCS